MYLNDVYTVTANLVGVPGVSVPCQRAGDPLPIGLQILGRHFDESTVLRLAHTLRACARDRRLERLPVALCLVRAGLAE